MTSLISRNEGKNSRQILEQMLILKFVNEKQEIKVHDWSPYSPDWSIKTKIRATTRRSLEKKYTKEQLIPKVWSMNSH